MPITVRDKHGNRKRIAGVGLPGPVGKSAYQYAVDGGYAGTEEEFSALMGGLNAQLSNPNLLENWYFADPINQRGQTEYTSNGYTIDRWTTTRVIVALQGGFLHLSKTDASDSGRFRKPIDCTFKAGTELTVSSLVRINSITGEDVVLRFSKGASLLGGYMTLYETAGKFQMFTCTITLSEDVDNLYIEPLWANAGTTADMDLAAAKLELGSRQTLAHQDADGNWVLNDPPPNKALELAKCQRYFYRLQSSNSNALFLGNSLTGGDNKGVVAQVHLPVPMRIVPALTPSSNDAIKITRTTYGNSTAVDSTNITANLASNTNHDCSTFLVNGPLPDSTSVYRMWLKSGEYLDFSADL